MALNYATYMPCATARKHEALVGRTARWAKTGCMSFLDRRTGWERQGLKQIYKKSLRIGAKVSKGCLGFK